MRISTMVFRCSVALFALAAWVGGFRPAGELLPSHPERDPATLLRGVWHRYPAGDLGSPVRFYYFHDDGLGLYRYGRQGLTYTNSFNWSVEADTLTLYFRKTGETHRVPFSLEQGGTVLHLVQDPKEGEDARYQKESSPTAATPLPLLGHIDGQMWIDFRPFATGGAAFSMYQLAPAALDGRGVGWHHRGDFDDWSTEAFRYQLGPGTLTLRFELAGDEHRSAVDVSDGDPPTLSLTSDPRNGWHRSRFEWFGKSFSSLWEIAR